MTALDLDAIRARNSLASVVGADVDLKLRGGDANGLLPVPCRSLA